MLFRRTPALAFALIVVGLSHAPTARAYRPFNGTDGDVAELGEFELELGPLQLLHEDRHNYLIAPATVLNLGILPRTELVVDFVGNVPLHAEVGEPRYQLRDTDVFLKFLLREGVLQEQGSGPSIALEAGLLTPEINGEKGFGAGADLIISERWGWFVAHLNNEAVLSRRSLQFAWSNSLITEFRFGRHIWPVTELRWEREFRSKASVYSALAGFIWSVSEDVDIDGAGIVASVEGRPGFEARLGFTWSVRVWGTSSEEEHEHGEARNN